MPKRTWTDDEIIILKENYASLSQVELQKQYFPKKSLDSIKWQIERQGLGKIEYYSETEEEIIRILRKNKVPCRTIGNLIKRSENAIRIKCTNMGFLSPSRDDFQETSISEIQQSMNTMDTKLIGTINEEYVRIKLALLGFELAIPFMNNHKTDLYILGKNGVAKIQIKSAVYDSENKRFRANLRTKNKSGEHIPYKNENVDFFIVKCNGIDIFYVLPFLKVEKELYANLYPHRIKLQIKGFDFENFKNRFDLISEFLEKDHRTIASTG